MRGQIKCQARTLVLLCLGSVAAACAAQAHTEIGWLLADQPNATGPYAPNPLYSYNSAGGTITIYHRGTGWYEFYFNSLDKIAGTDNVQLTAYATDGYCMLGPWDMAVGEAERGYVLCFDPSGQRADQSFSMEWQQRTTTFGNASKGMAFLYADKPSLPTSYTPDPSFNFNSTGPDNTIVRNGTGNYTVTIPGLNSLHSDVQVTAYSNSGHSGARCKVSSWQSNGTGGTSIDVLCFDNAGNAADERYSLAYSVAEPFGLDTSATARGAWAWANHPNSTTTYTPSGGYQFNTFGTGRLMAIENSTGNYTVTIPGSLSYNHSHVLVTSHGSDNGYCNVLDWATETIDIACYAQGGAPAISDFDAVFQTED